MINLLPQTEKRGLLYQKNRNLVIVLGSVSTIFLLCLSLVLLSLKFYILQEIKHEEIILKDTEERYQTKDFQSLLDFVKKFNSYLYKVEGFYKRQVYLSDALKTILDVQRPNSITFDNIILNYLKEERKIKASIYGLSINRDELISFKERVEVQAKISNVYLPPEHLVQAENVRFYMTFDIKLND